MELELIHEKFSVCKLSNMKNINWNEEYVFFGKTDTELSLVCRTDAIPENAIEQENGYIAFRIKGQLDFALTGILAPIAQLLAEAAIAIFVVSTFDTDYVLIKENTFEQTKSILLAHGYCFVESK